MRKNAKKTKNAATKELAGHKAGSDIARNPAGNSAPPAPETFILPVEAEFYKQALRLMADLPKVLAGEDPNTAAKGIVPPGPRRAGSLDARINAALAETGKLLGVSRVYVMLDEAQGRYLRNTHEWVDGKIGPAMHSWPLHDYEKDIPSLKGLMANKDFLAGHTRDMPLDMQRVLGMQGVDSVLLTPLLRDGVWLGLLGFDSCGKKRIWQEEEIIILRYLARLIGLFLEQREYADARRTLADIRELLDRKSSLSAAPAHAAGADGPPETAGRALSLQEAERRLIVETLARCKGNKSEAARQLGLKWAALDRRCKKLRIEIAARQD